MRQFSKRFFIHVAVIILVFMVTACATQSAPEVVKAEPAVREVVSIEEPVPVVEEASTVEVEAAEVIEEAAPAATITFYIPTSSGSVELNMRVVEAGTFTMGSPMSEIDRDSDETPHEVTITKPYLVGTYEVTQQQWEAVMESSNPSNFKGDNLPVESVIWYEVVKFCNELSSLVGKEPAYTINGTTVSCDFSKNGFRLPTEAEWEYAARGGGLSDGYKIYAGSDSLSEVGWYEYNSGEKTHTVGGKEPNALGLYDMSGNVWEWCWDWYDRSYYAASDGSDPTGPQDGSRRILRGGSWSYYNSGYCRSATRVGYPPDMSYCLGFRLAASLP